MLLEQKALTPPRAKRFWVRSYGVVWSDYEWRAEAAMMSGKTHQYPLYSAALFTPKRIHDAAMGSDGKNEENVRHDGA